MNVNNKFKFTFKVSFKTNFEINVNIAVNKEVKNKRAFLPEKSCSSEILYDFTAHLGELGQLLQV